MPLQKIFCPSCRKSFFAALSEPGECSCGNCGTLLTVGIDGRISLKQSKQIASSLGNAPVRQPIAVRDQPVASRADPPELPATGLFATFSAGWDTIRKFVPVIVTVLGSIIFSVFVLVRILSPPPPTSGPLDTSRTLVRARRLSSQTTETTPTADRRPPQQVGSVHAARGTARSQPSATVPAATGGGDGLPGTAEKGGTGGTSDDRQEKKAGSADSSTSLDVFDRVKISVAQIKTPSGTGSGFVAEPGLLVTNYHVICDSNPEEVVAVFPDHPTRSNTEFKLQLIAEDTLNDIVVLAVAEELEPLNVPPAYELRKGEEITVVGSPGTSGNRSLLNFPTDGRMGGEILDPCSDVKNWSLSLAVNHGNSGGPVVARHTGAVLGVVKSRPRSSLQIEGHSFAVPHAALLHILDNARDRFSATRQEATSLHAIRKAAFSLKEFAQCLKTISRRVTSWVEKQGQKSSKPAKDSLQAYIVAAKFELDEGHDRINSHQAICDSSIRKILGISRYAVEIETLRQCHREVEIVLELLRTRPPNEHVLDSVLEDLWDAIGRVEASYTKAMEILDVACYL